MPSVPERFDVTVVGGGVMGLAALRALARRGARAALLERLEPGHDRGSSHGPTRVFRAGYPDARYVELARAARGAWRELEEAAGVPLLDPRPCLFFGPPNGLIEAYERGTAGPGSGIRRIDAKTARARFPALALPESGVVLEETGAAVVAAERAVRALLDQARAAGATLFCRRAVRAIERASDRLVIHTDRGPLASDRAVVTAGAWTARLLPELSVPLTPLRQTVGYLRLSEPVAMPIWIRLGRAPGDVHYGLPTDRPDVIKIARHVTSGPGDDPDARPDQPDPEALADLTRAAAAIVSAGVLEVAGWDSCLYTSTPSEDFVLDRLPADARITVGAGFSGHGFKFAPLIGEALAELSLHGRFGQAAFEALAGNLALAAREP